jgi:ABC-2 type transport system ATP-binding protein
MLEVRNLTKLYVRRPAVDDVSFTIRPGEILGYLGPNGSGKSTTVKMLTGLLEPSRGLILWQGRNIRQDLIGYKKSLGYVPEAPLELRIDQLLNLLSLHEHRYSPISSYSKGMKQKILISASLLHNPDIMVFDEPFSGLDVTTSLVFKNLIKVLAREGKAILYSSHVLEVVEKVCTSVIILRKGCVVANDSVARLRDLMALPSLEGIFSQLVMQEDTEKIAEDIVDVMQA